MSYTVADKTGRSLIVTKLGAAAFINLGIALMMIATVARFPCIYALPALSESL